MMNNISHWRKNMFCAQYKLYSDEDRVGKLQNIGYCYSALGQWKDTRYKFKVTGILHQYVEVQDLIDGSVVDNISFSCWWPKASIRMGDQYWDWRFTDWFFHAFLMTSEREKIYFESDQKGGEVFGNSENTLAVMSGLFVLNYYRQMMIIYIAALFPLLLFALN